jgi:hypothetical protein
MNFRRKSGALFLIAAAAFCMGPMLKLSIYYGHKENKMFGNISN